MNTTTDPATLQNLNPGDLKELASVTSDCCVSILMRTHRSGAAVESGDYTKFRMAMYPIEESLRDRIGRWVQRYPQIQASIGTRFTIADIVEETFMLAFDRYHGWKPEMFFGQWIETLIDPAMKAIADRKSVV